MYHLLYPMASMPLVVDYGLTATKLIPDRWGEFWTKTKRQPGWAASKSKETLEAVILCITEGTPHCFIEQIPWRMGWNGGTKGLRHANLWELVSFGRKYGEHSEIPELVAFGTKKRVPGDDRLAKGLYCPKLIRFGGSYQRLCEWRIEEEVTNWDASHLQKHTLFLTVSEKCNMPPQLSQTLF